MPPCWGHILPRPRVRDTATVAWQAWCHKRLRNTRACEYEDARLQERKEVPERWLRQAPPADEPTPLGRASEANAT
jgi:hypothetical protein